MTPRQAELVFSREFLRLGAAVQRRSSVCNAFIVMIGDDVAAALLGIVVIGFTFAGRQQIMDGNRNVILISERRSAPIESCVVELLFLSRLPNRPYEIAGISRGPHGPSVTK